MKGHVSFLAFLALVVMPAVAAEPKSVAEALEKGKACFDKKDYDGAILCRL